MELSVRNMLLPRLCGMLGLHAGAEGVCCTAVRQAPQLPGWAPAVVAGKHLTVCQVCKRLLVATPSGSVKRRLLSPRSLVGTVCLPQVWFVDDSKPLSCVCAVGLSGEVMQLLGCPAPPAYPVVWGVCPPRAQLPARQACPPYHALWQDCGKQGGHRTLPLMRHRSRKPPRAMPVAVVLKHV